uniref:Uncharacterized protein n=1 Tax=Rhizophora mucronata TaxID=61149 RepID=A0A2P2P6S8_RHIMU
MCTKGLPYPCSCHTFPT